MKKTKESTPCYCVTFPLKTEKWQEDKINAFFEHCRRLYNQCNHILLHEYKKIENKLDEFSKEYKAIPKENTKERKEASNRKTAFLESLHYNKDGITTRATKETGKDYALYSKFGVVNLLIGLTKKDLGNGFSYGKLGENNISINATMKSEIANRLISAYEKLLWSDGKFIRMKKRDEFNSIKQSVDVNVDKSLMIDMENHIFSIKFGKNKFMRIPFLVKKRKDEKGMRYEEEVLSKRGKEIRELGFKRIMIRGKWKYYMTISVSGIPYGKGRKLGDGTIGIDPGVASITLYGKTIEQFTIPKDILADEKKIAKTQRYLDRSRRANNPDCFKEDGQYIKGKKIKVKSKHYIKAKNKLKELQRKVADKRKRFQIDFINEKVLPQGTIFNVEKNKIDKWARRKEGITKKANGSIASNKRHGKSIGKVAPAQFLSLLKNKGIALGGVYNEISETAAATATDHTDNFKRTHRGESERVVTLTNGNTHDRDTHAAFNLKHFDPITNTYNLEKMNADYPKFCEEEKKVWNTLKYQK